MKRGIADSGARFRLCDAPLACLRGAVRRSESKILSPANDRKRAPHNFTGKQLP